MMHSVISSECSGCELCLEPCPVACIEMRTNDCATVEPDAQQAHWRRREEYHDFRLANPDPRLWPGPKSGAGGLSREAAQREIAAAVARVAARRKRS